MKMNLTPKPGPVPETHPAVESIVRQETLASDAETAATDEILAMPVPRVVDVNESDRPARSMTKLVDDNFPFDDTQKAAIEGLSKEKHACMTGAAGTGKTTCLKAVVDRIIDDLPHVDMSTYFKKDVKTEDPEDDYDVPEQLIPGVVLCAYTGRASQMIKRNFPRDWHGNIMTIHRMLGFYPVWEPAEDPDTGEMKNKVRFIPAYNRENKLPWKVILIDESGMLGLDLWNQLLDAVTEDCRIIMVGDINQLPPTHGRSIFGFAMAKWPSWELTHIHRQQGVNNSIVDNAWRIINGTYPQSDDPKSGDWKFVMMKLPDDSGTASKHVRKWLETIRGPLYDPIRDTVITPINAYEENAAGYALGQDPLNRELAIIFNKDNGRYIIDAGRERKYFAVGDKVMATKNNHEAGITNGMTGVIKEIITNHDYKGNHARYGLVEDVNAYLSSGIIEEDIDFDLTKMAALIAEEPKEKESKDRGPASHSVVVEFGHGDSSFDQAFTTLAEVSTLMTAYVVTCHKMQGGEVPFVVVICHQSHKRMLTREWLYTAVTRGSEKVVVLYTQQGMAAALGKQTIKGKNLQEKVESFNRMQDKGGLLGASVDVRLPEAETLTGSRELTRSGGGQVMTSQPIHRAETAEPTPASAPVAETAPTPIHIHVTVVEQRAPEPVKPVRESPVDGGTLKPSVKPKLNLNLMRPITAPVEAQKLVESYRKIYPQLGAVMAMQKIEDLKAQRLLPRPTKPLGLNLWDLVKAQRTKESANV